MSDPFLSEIRIMAFNFAPKGWAMCNGQVLPINQNQALFSLMGTMYGGNGQTTFALPNLQGRVAVGIGGNQGIVQGQLGGEINHTLAISEMPTHIHQLMADAATASASNTNTPGPTQGAKVLGQSGGTSGTPPAPFGANMYSTASPTTTLFPGSVATSGGSQPHQNEQPYLVVNFCIALQGIFPSRN
jgi:microcystin-dependent protein